MRGKRENKCIKPHTYISNSPVKILSCDAKELRHFQQLFLWHHPERR